LIDSTHAEETRVVVLDGKRLVDEHQSIRIKIELTLEPGPAPAKDVGPLLLGGVRGLFLRVMLWRSKNRQTDATLTDAPRAASASRISSNVRSAFVSINEQMKPWCASIKPDRESPPWRLGNTLPVRSVNCRQRIALAALTPKRAPAARQESPPSIAATTRSRKSTDKARPIPAGLLHQQGF